MGIIQRRQDAIDNSRMTNQSGPLRRVVDCKPTAWAGFGWFDILECGHNGHALSSKSYVQHNIDGGKRRRCAACGKADRNG